MDLLGVVTVVGLGVVGPGVDGLGVVGAGVDGLGVVGNGVDGLGVVGAGVGGKEWHCKKRCTLSLGGLHYHKRFTLSQLNDTFKCFMCAQEPDVIARGLQTGEQTGSYL